MCLCDGPDALKGLKEVQVFILPNKLTDDIQFQIRNDVEIKLKMIGLKVNPNATEILCINVLTNEVGGEISSYYGSIEILLRHPRIQVIRIETIQTDAIIWKSNVHLLHGPPEGFNKRCREGVKDLVDSFINDYLTTNGGMK